MTEYKKAKVIMLPTEDKSKLTLDDKELFLNNVEKMNENFFGYKNQHLYIVSSYGIKKDNWCYDKRDNSIFKIKIDLEEGDGCELIFKIIATTDSKLGLVTDGNDVPMPAYSKLLPQPSQQFIEKYIEEYNNDNIITDVLVEYDLVWDEEYSTDGIHSMVKCNNPREILKINTKDNTITIKQEKETLKDIMIKNPDIKKEVKQLLIDCCGEVSCEDGVLKGKSPSDLYKWIEENL